ncbi:MAG: hypothetical protein WC563_05935 [Brevundimonas sp.]
MQDPKRPKAFRVAIDHEDKVMENFFTPPYRELTYIAEAEVGRLMFAWTRAENALVSACTYWNKVHNLLDPSNVSTWVDPGSNFKRIENWRSKYAAPNDNLGNYIADTLRTCCEWRNNCAHNVTGIPESPGWPSRVHGWVDAKNFEAAQTAWFKKVHSLGAVTKAGPPPTPRQQFTYSVDDIADLAQRCSGAANVVAWMESSLAHHYFWRERAARRISMCGDDTEYAEMHRRILTDEDLARARTAKADDPDGWIQKFSPSFVDFDWDAV